MSFGRRHDSFVPHPPSATGKEQEVGREGSWPLSSWSNFTHSLFNINKLVTFALHLAGKVSNNTWIPSENVNDWHALGPGCLLPRSLLRKVLYISRGQTLAWAGAV